jgi:hypothetical protein
LGQIGVKTLYITPGSPWSKGKVLDEFVAVTGFHRKHAMRVLRLKRPGFSGGSNL